MEVYCAAMPDNFIFCSKCGTQNAAAAQFCQNCGAGLSAGLAPASSVVAPPGYTTARAVTYPAALSAQYGGFWIRLLAHLIDHLILGAVAAPFFFAMILPSIVRIAHEAQRNQEPPPELVAAIVSSVALYACLAFVGNWIYEALLTSSSWQGTIGKHILHLKVTDESFGRSTGRYFAKILSGLVMYVGFIMIGFTDRKRGMHDLLAGTLVQRY